MDTCRLGDSDDRSVPATYGSFSEVDSIHSSGCGGENILSLRVRSNLDPKDVVLTVSLVLIERYGRPRITERSSSITKMVTRRIYLCADPGCVHEYENLVLNSTDHRSPLRYPTTSHDVRLGSYTSLFSASTDPRAISGGPEPHVHWFRKQPDALDTVFMQHQDAYLPSPDVFCMSSFDNICCAGKPFLDIPAGSL